MISGIHQRDPGNATAMPGLHYCLWFAFFIFSIATHADVLVASGRITTVGAGVAIGGATPGGVGALSDFLLLAAWLPIGSIGACFPGASIESRAVEDKVRDGGGCGSGAVWPPASLLASV